jgi:hypothetical protein
MATVGELKTKIEEYKQELDSKNKLLQKKKNIYKTPFTKKKANDRLAFLNEEIKNFEKRKLDILNNRMNKIMIFDHFVPHEYKDEKNDEEQNKIFNSYENYYEILINIINLISETIYMKVDKNVVDNYDNYVKNLNSLGINNNDDKNDDENDDENNNLDDVFNSIKLQADSNSINEFYIKVFNNFDIYLKEINELLDNYDYTKKDMKHLLNQIYNKYGEIHNYLNELLNDEFIKNNMNPEKLKTIQTFLNKSIEYFNNIPNPSTLKGGTFIRSKKTKTRTKRNKNKKSKRKRSSTKNKKRY